MLARAVALPPSQVVKPIFWLLWPALAACAGCLLPMQPEGETGLSSRPSADRPPATAAPPAEGTDERSNSPTDPPSAAGQPPTAALAEVMEELQKLGALDPAAQQRLIDDLKQTDARLWPLLLQQFRASLAYRQQTDAGAKEKENSASQPTTVTAAAPRDPLASPVSSIHTPPSSPGSDSRSSPASLPPADRADATTAANRSGANTASASPEQPAPVPARDQHAQATQVAHAAPPAGGQAVIAPLEPTRAEPSSPSSAAVASDSQQALDAVIRSLERRLAEPPADVTLEVRLRVLYLLAGRRDDALRPIPGLKPAEQDFWSKELYGLAVYLDTARTPDDRRRAAEAVQHLHGAAARLGQLATLVVKNLAFCSEVTSYGVLTRFEREHFKPGEQLLLYAEVENFTSQPTPEGFHTALQARYELFNSRGERVEEQDFPLTEEKCLNARRDFFIRYFIRLPQPLYDGKYTLKLTIEDTLGEKVGQSSIDFHVKDKPRGP